MNNRKTIKVINLIRKLFGYKFPRLGFLAKYFYDNLPKLIYCELFQNIFIDLNMEDGTQKSTFWQGDRFEYPTAKILNEWGSNLKDIYFFDIGSNYGFYSYLMCSYFDKIKCFAFEPNPQTFNELKITIRLNNLTQKISPFNMGLGSTKDKLVLRLGNMDSGQSTFLVHPEFNDTSVDKIQIDTFDNWLIENNLELPTSPKWIAKIDVEGYEVEVLKGMVNALRKKVFIGISIETLEYTLALNINKISDIEEIMKTFGYKKISPITIKEKYGRIRTVNSFFVPYASDLY